ncbi:MAG: DUF3540 domain-containing protein [Planctomycetes bacterium]|nr:DUF3540 domain-containing protein [Planctomycetota bacterium]
MEELRTTEGSRVAVREDGILETRDRQGRILFEYDPATGRAAVYAPGDLRIRSGGCVEIDAEHGVKITTPGTFETNAGRVFEFATDAYCRVEKLLHVTAGRVRTQVEGAWLVQSDTARVQAEGDVKLQGETILLG